jgi:hypothetical protein
MFASLHDVLVATFEFLDRPDDVTRLSRIHHSMVYSAEDASTHLAMPQLRFTYDNLFGALLALHAESTTPP